MNGLRKSQRTTNIIKNLKNLFGVGNKQRAVGLFLSATPFSGGSKNLQGIISIIRYDEDKADGETRSLCQTFTNLYKAIEAGKRAPRGRELGELTKWKDLASKIFDNYRYTRL